MKKKIIFSFVLFLPGLALLLLTGCGKKWSEKDMGTIRIMTNKGGQTLGYSSLSGVKILTVNGFAFKDLNRNGKLDKYEDWRLPVDERAKDLASKLTIEEIAGLMLYSRHQAIPAAGGFFGGTYNGKPYKESGAKPSDLSDQQVEFLTKNNLRHVLITSVESPEVAAEWNNNAQALVEKIGFGIPINTSSDPRHQTVANAEYNAGGGGKISMWPGSLGLAATFDPSVTKEFGHIAAQEYRGLGITTALSPQIDIATDPRWNRFNGTFGEDPKLATDMARAYVDGFQTSSDSTAIAGGWGYTSVNAMVKHWPGGGSGEGGRDAHFAFGKFAVYPGHDFAQHMVPFVEGAFKLEGPTGEASAVMPYYTISYNQDPSGQNVGNSYSSYIIDTLLRGNNKYDGVVCTDWGITADAPEMDNFTGGKPWGVEDKSVAERHYMVLMAGVDQFGGNNDSKPVMEAYQIGVKEHGEAFMRKRFEESAVRLLRNIFRVGLFENPYLSVENTKKVVGNPVFMAAGYQAQLKSIVLLKNHNHVLPLSNGKKVYIPRRLVPGGRDWFGNVTQPRWEYPVNMDIAKKYFEVTDNPAEADAALVFVNSPNPGPGYNKEDLKKGGNGYFPMTLQYLPYKAVYARDPSIAGDKRDVLNRTYRNKTTTAANTADLKLILDTRKVMKNKPVIVAINTSNPMVFGEFEKWVDGILVHFSVQDQALMDIVTGVAEPSALLPMQMPADMKTVEEQYEDVPHDMKCYVDSEGNTYDFGFGMNWSGKISDNRTEHYTWIAKAQY